MLRLVWNPLLALCTLLTASTLMLWGIAGFTGEVTLEYRSSSRPTRITGLHFYPMAIHVSQHIEISTAEPPESWWLDGVRDRDWRGIRCRTGTAREVRHGPRGDGPREQRDYRYASVLCPYWYPLPFFGVYPSAALLWWVAFPFRRWLRSARGLCPVCRYDLTGNVSGICPECGRNVEG
jgi:hypothetical protein